VKYHNKKENKSMAYLVFAIFTCMFINVYFYLNLVYKIS